MAIRCFDLAQETIAIIEKSSGTLCHRIENIYNVLKMHLEGKYLYVLSRNSEGLSKLLKYDTEDWEKEPWVLDIPGFVIKFHYSSHGLLFIKQAPDKLFQMLHIKNHIFSNETPVFIESAPQSQFPHIKIADDGFLTFTSAEDTSEDNPSVWLEKLCFENSTIAKKPLQKLPLDYDSIRDFEILFDKVIINSKNYAGNACSFFDLTNGNLIKDLISTMTVSNELFYTLQLLPNKSIQLLSDDGRNLQTRIGINLDFKI